MKHIIGITGLIHSGKDFAADYIVNKYNYIKLNMSDVLKDELEKQFKEPTKMNMSILADEWRKIYGYDIVMKRTLEKAKNYEKIIITGIRSPEEIDYLKSNVSSLKLISIETSKETRFSRRINTDPQTSKEFFCKG